MLRPRTKYKIRLAVFVMALIGVAFFAGSAGRRSSEHRPPYAPDSDAQHYSQEGGPYFVVGRIDWNTILTFGLCAATFLLWIETARATENATQASISSQRAFVFANKFQKVRRTILRFRKSTTTAWKIYPIWENSGTSPTKHMVAYVNVLFTDGQADIPSTFTFSENRTTVCAADPTPLFVGARSNAVGELADIPSTTLLDIHEGRQRGFIWGWADYNDIFPHTSRHRTEFCFEIMVSKDPMGTDEDALRFRNYGRYNGADDECREHPAAYFKAN